jgi:TRAP-type C4-dicarboxylate transport system permease small subunit
MSREIFRKVDRTLELILRWGSTICLVGLLIIVVGVVFVRFVPFTSMGWTDEIVEFAFAWMVFLCSANLWRKRTHFRVELIPDWLSGSKAGRVLEIVLSFLSLVFFLVFTYQGLKLAIQATDRSPIFEYPKTLWYMSIPVSGVIMIGYTVRDLVGFFRHRVPEK